LAQGGHHEQLSKPDDVKPPSEKSFGLTFAAILSLIAAWLYLRKDLPIWTVASLAASIAFLAAAFLAPALLRPLNLAWSRFGLLLHRIVNPIVMGLLFFLVFTPTGFIMRALGKDLLRLKRDPSRSSYWIHRADESHPPSKMTNQF